MAVGVPVICPCELRVSPAGGKLLPVTNQLKVPVAPTAAKVCEYADPIDPFGSEVVPMPSTFKVKVAEACALEASVTTIPMGKTPPDTGVPDSWPVFALMDNPSALVPLCKVKV